MTAAAQTFFFHIGDFAAGGHLAVLADDTTAREGGEAKKPDDAAHAIPPFTLQQYLYRRAA